MQTENKPQWQIAKNKFSTLKQPDLNGCETLTDVASKLKTQYSTEYGWMVLSFQNIVTLNFLGTPFLKVVGEQIAAVENRGRAFGCLCPLCGDQIYDNQTTDHTEEGMAHSACCEDIEGNSDNKEDSR